MSEFQQSVTELNRLCLELVSIVVNHRGIGDLTSKLAGVTRDDVLAATKCLPRLLEIRNRMEALVRDVGAEIRMIGHENDWESTVMRLVEPGYHLALARFVCEAAIPSALIAKVGPEGFRPREDVECFVNKEPACVALDSLLHLRPGHEKLRYSLEREAFKLAKVTPISPGVAPGDRVAIDHRTRRFVILGDARCEMKLSENQVNYVVLCLFARKRNAWFQTDDFKKLGAIGNPSGVYGRLPQEVQDLIESGKEGRRMACDGEVTNAVELPSGIEIDWKTLEYGDPRKRQRAS